MTSQSYPNKIVRQAVDNAFDAMLRAGEFPKVAFKQRASNPSLDNTEYNKHWAAFVHAVDKWLKSVGVSNGFHTKTTKAAYEVLWVAPCSHHAGRNHQRHRVRFPAPQSVEV